ncbi:hypothetical protein BH24ACT5_BH24ACT5_17050 [soil metagenome]
MNTDEHLDDVCITCGDVAVELIVVSVDGGEAVCAATDEGREHVAVDLVSPVEPGDHVLVHAKVAIAKVPVGQVPVRTVPA